MPDFPKKTRDIQNHHMDSTIWDDFPIREDDIFIATYCKSGTTWMQQIVSQLLFKGEEGLPVSEMSPWLDLRVPPRDVKLPLLDAQTHRRFLKTHLPVDALRFSPTAKYIYTGRDGRDVVWSLHNHHLNANAAWYAALNDTPGRVGPPIEPPQKDIVRYFSEWLAKDGAPFWSFWENVQSWWAIRDLPNVLLVHFSDLKADLDGQIRRIADFIECPVDEVTLARVVEHCSFDYMKSNAAQTAPLGGGFWEGGAKTFIHKGKNGRWKERLPPSLSDQYDQTALSKLGADCAHWLKAGSL